MSAPICRFCGAEAAKQRVKGDYVYGGAPDQKFWHCASCDMIYLSPPLDEADEAKFYAQEFEKFMAGRAGSDMDWTGPEKHVATSQREANRRLPFLKPYIAPGKRVLEVGCSSGFMLMPLKDAGMSVTGIDPSGGFIDFVRSKNITCYASTDDLDAAEPGARFDLILHYYVFEHIRHPVEFIRQYMAKLAPGGTMLFEVPCAADPLSELYAVPAFDRFYWSIAHHWYFTRKSLSRVLDAAECRYELLPEQRYDLSNHVVWMRDGKPGGYGRYADTFGPELDALYKQRMRESWNCDTLVAVVRKQ